MNTKPPTLKDALISVGVGVLPIVIMVLVSKPALRQAIAMRVVLAARNVAVQQMGFWQDTSFTLARLYDRVRL